MAAPPEAPFGAALTLEGASLQLATITAPLPPLPAALQQQQPAGQPELWPPPPPPRRAQLQAALAAVRRLATPALPFAALAAGEDAVRVVCLKGHTANVFKLLRAQQAALGITLGEVKAAVSLQPLPAPDLEAACSAGLLAALLHRGWHALGEDRLLGASPLVPAADGAAQVCGSLTLRVAAVPGDAARLRLLVRAEQVEFRHPSCKPGASLEDRSARLKGSGVTLLPDLRPAIVERLRPADASTLARLRPLWAAHGMSLPPEGQKEEGSSSSGHLVEVCLEDDPDAPAFPYPPCRVLGPFGLQPLADRRSSLAVQAVLARLRDDLQATPFKFLGDKVRVAPTAHDWWPDGMPAPKGRAAAPEAAPPPPLIFTTARQLETELASKPPEAAKEDSGSGGSKPVDLAAQLGAEFRLDDFTAGEGGAGVQLRQRRQWAAVPPKLQAAFDEAKRQQAEAERPAGAPPGGATPATAASSAAPVGRQPLALRQAAAAASGSQPRAPAFKKIAGAAPAAAPKKPAGTAGKAAAGQKRPAAAKPPTGAKRPKAATAAAAAPTPPASEAAGAALPPSAPASAAAAAAAGGSAAAQQGSMALPSAAAAAQAAAPPKAPAKPRPKAADIDLAAVTAKVQAAVAPGGSFAKITLPELKAYLKSIKQPVGGKKGDLEDRVRVALGGAGGGGAAPTPAAATAAATGVAC
ncbi:hypothetical protein C2E21_5110 [Chlorella sorokiniana]|uniref:SAP domain-containing protein n=1 Tax=Chlorella sorokiniana TaxID=3076 RepID=A0A2P6TPV0_CHLSO|nr:hypothetical protein C2E21_5110 [Chlorella sorokiniana]|eukprot:PRW56060.1 hypothetical protein C2E21_5110 [Chlorella sorokiniana]